MEGEEEVSDQAVLEVESDKGFAGRDDPDNLLGMVAWMAAHSTEADPPEPPDAEDDDWGAADYDTPKAAGPQVPSRAVAEADWNPDVHPRDRLGRWRHNALSSSMSETEWRARSKTVHTLYHYTELARGEMEPIRPAESAPGHGGTHFTTFPRADLPGREVRVHGHFNVFDVKDASLGEDAIWQGHGNDPAFNRLLSETAREVGLPDKPGEGYSYEAHGAWRRYSRRLTERVAEKLRAQGYDGIHIGGELYVWNYDKLEHAPTHDALRDADPAWPNPDVLDTLQRDHGPMTVVNHALADRLEAAGVGSAEGLNEVPQRVTDDTISAIQFVRSQIKPTEKAPDPLHIDSLGARKEGTPGPVMTTWWDPEDGTTNVTWNPDEREEVAVPESFAAQQGYVSWSSRDPYGRSLHEMGHVYQRHMTGVDDRATLLSLEAAGMVELRGEGDDLQWRPARNPSQQWGGRDPGWPSIYAQSDPAEAFGEMFALLMRPEGLKHYDDKTLMRKRLIAFRKKWNEQMREQGLPTIPEISLT